MNQTKTPDVSYSLARNSFARRGAGPDEASQNSDGSLVIRLVDMKDIQAHHDAASRRRAAGSIRKHRFAVFVGGEGLIPTPVYGVRSCLQLQAMCHDGHTQPVQTTDRGQCRHTGA